MTGAMPLGTADSRRLAILEAVKESRIVRVSELSRRFGVSEVCIRRDLAKLGRYGLLKRIHGGAVHAADATPDRGYEDRSKAHLDEKKRIAAVAASLVQPGDRIILDSGTTVLEVAREIAAGKPVGGQITVITASFPVFRALADVSHVHLIVLGGMYLREYQTLVGPQTLESLRGLHVDRLFLGADGLSLRSGLTTANVLEAEVSKAMVRAAAEVVVTTDSSKIDNVGFTTILSAVEINKLVTDTGAPADFVSALRQQGVDVIEV